MIQGHKQDSLIPEKRNVYNNLNYNTHLNACINRNVFFYLNLKGKYC